MISIFNHTSLTLHFNIFYVPKIDHLNKEWATAIGLEYLYPFKVYNYKNAITCTISLFRKIIFLLYFFTLPFLFFTFFIFHSLFSFYSSFIFLLWSSFPSTGNWRCLLSNNEVNFHGFFNSTFGERVALYNNTGFISLNSNW